MSINVKPVFVQLGALAMQGMVHRAGNHVHVKGQNL